MTALPSLSRRSLLVLGGAAPLAGCLPAPYGTYYQPTVATGASRPVRAYCGGQAGPPTKLEFEPVPGLVFRAEVTQPEGGERRLVLNLAVPPGTWQFEQDAVRLNGAELPVTLRAWAMRRRSAEAVVDARTVAPAPDSLPASEWPRQAHQVQLAGHGSAQWDGPLPPLLRLHWPAMHWSDGRRTVPAPQDLHARNVRGWVHYQSDAHVQRSQDRHDRCRRETPQRNCQYLLDDTDHGFFWDLPDAWMDGRVFSTEPSKSSLNLQWSLVQRTPGAWRWNDAQGVQARLEDPATSRIVQVALGMPSLSVAHEKLPLSTRLLSPLGSPTSLRVEVPLQPPGLAEYQLHWPALRREGQRIEMPAMKLQRHSLDGGFLPFNC